MNRDQIIETMAMSLAVGRGRIAAGPGEIKEAERALTAVLPMIRAEALEEAAKVAENAFTQECCGLGVGSPMECCADPICVALAPHEIATVLRAMKGGEG